MVKVCVLGAFGGIGQPLSLLLKINPCIDELSLYDIADCHGLGTDLSHINTKSITRGFDKNGIREALEGSDIVVIPAGMARKEGMTRDDLFKVNASIMKTLCMHIGQVCSENVKVLIISNPVNCLVPVAIETFKRQGKSRLENVIGVTMLDVIRAETFLKEHLCELSGDKESDPLEHEMISVVGGHSGTTIVPIVADKKIIKRLGMERYDKLVKRIQFGGDEVIKAKKSSGSATLSMAYAADEVISSIISSMTVAVVKRDSERIEHCRRQRYRYLPGYVYLPSVKGGFDLKRRLRQVGHFDVDYFAIPLKFTNGSISQVDLSVLDDLSQEEIKLLRAAMEPLQANIKKGEKFVKNAAKM